MNKGKGLLEALVEAGFKPTAVKLSKESEEKIARQYRERQRQQAYARKHLKCPYDKTKLVLGAYTTMSGQRTQKIYICPKCQGYIEKDMTKKEEKEYQERAKRIRFANAA